MKMNVIGISAKVGTSKAGKPYRIGQVHTMAALAPAFGDDATEKGMVGTSYACDPEVVNKIKHLSFPLIAEVETEAQVRFGTREEVVIDVKPVSIERKSA